MTFGCVIFLSQCNLGTNINYQNFNVLYIPGKVLYYFNLFNIPYFDCPALPLHLQFMASVNCEEEIRLLTKKITKC